MTDEVLVIEGDGVGREVVPAAVEVLEATDAPVSFESAAAGDAVAEQRGEPLPAETRERAAAADAVLFGAAGETAADVILPLRAAVGSFANVRPVRAFPGVDALQPETDLVFLRENTEGVYAGHEAELAGGVATTTRVVTREASRRIGEFGFDYAADRGLSVTVAHKANVMRATDGLFREAVTAVGDERGVDYETALMDALATELVQHPTAHEAVITPNLAGDVLSDLAAGLVGGLGLLPSANVGRDGGLFEPVHGTAPDIAGEGIANPAATLLSAALMLEHLGHDEAGTAVRTAVEGVLSDGPRTPDLGGEATTATVTRAVIDRL